MNLENERIRLRRLRISDVDDIVENINHKDIAKWTLNIPHPYLKQDAINFILFQRRRFRAGTFFVYGIELKSTRKVIGLIGLSQTDRKNKKSMLGYWVGKKYWNNGIATEAVRIILNFGFQELKLNRISAKTFCDAKSSQRVLEKNGFKLEGVLRKSLFKRNRYHDENVYGLLKSEFKR